MNSPCHIPEGSVESYISWITPVNQKRHLGIAATGFFCCALLSSVRCPAKRYMTWNNLLIASEIIKLLFLFRTQCSFRKRKRNFISFSSVVQLTPLPYWILSKLLAIYLVPEISRTESSVNACQSWYDHLLDFFFPLGFLHYLTFSELPLTSAFTEFSLLHLHCQIGFSVWFLEIEK